MTKYGVYMACRRLNGSAYMKLLWWLKNNCPKFNQNVHIRCTLPSYFILLCIFNQLLIILIPYVHVYMPYFATERITHALFRPSIKNDNSMHFQKCKYVVPSITSWRI